MDVRLPDTLCCTLQDGFAVLALCRPGKLNALDDATICAIGRVFTHPTADAKAVVLHGEGPHFSAGLDLSALTERGTASGIAHSRTWRQAFRAIESGSIPVIAVLHGAVSGGWLELAAGADVRVSERDAFHTLPEG